jgi:hypothetical protein
MRKLLAMTTAVLALLIGCISFALPSQAATNAFPLSAQAAQMPLEAAGNVHAATTPSPTGESSPSAAPSDNPVNPGTGEPAEDEGTRLDWAPYVIGAIVLGAILAAVLWRRRRHDKTVV